MRINFGVNKREGKRVVHKNDSLFIDMDENSPSFMDTILAKIKELYPNWNITGYAPVTEGGEG